MKKLFPCTRDLTYFADKYANRLDKQCKINYN